MKAEIANTTRGPRVVFWLSFDGGDATDVKPETYRRFQLTMRNEGIRVAPGGRWYVNAAHTEADLEQPCGPLCAA
jgi:hypothetical protein